MSTPCRRRRVGLLPIKPLVHLLIELSHNLVEPVAHFLGLLALSWRLLTLNHLVFFVIFLLLSFIYMTKSI